MIDGDLLLEEIEKYATGYNGHDGFYEARQVQACIKLAPTIDVVVHGRWLPSNYKPTLYDRCSECDARKDISDNWKFCPSCGAKMAEEESYE